MKSGNRELVDRLAAEYVLGTLRGRARRRFERWLVSPQVGAIVKAWESRLAGLEPRLEGVTPPPAVWTGIEKRLDLRRRSRAPAMRWLAVAASLVFVATIAFFALRTPALPATQLASLQSDSQTIYWRVEVLGDHQQLRLQVDRVHELPAGRAHELWALPANGGAPVSLGLMPHTGAEQRVLNAAQRAALASARQIAVSLEPSGGSPSGAPTGPVLLVAALAPA